jgi:hypothetical protein
MAISGSRLQFLLARSENFTSRVQVTLCRIANGIFAETGVGASHAARIAYARAVLTDPGTKANAAALYLAQAPNVQGEITMEDEGPRTSVTDAALESQVATSWDVLAGVDAGN